MPVDGLPTVVTVEATVKEWAGVPGACAPPAELRQWAPFVEFRRRAPSVGSGLPPFGPVGVARPVEKHRQFGNDQCQRQNRGRYRINMHLSSVPVFLRFGGV
jgi:hypothetical protein